nr:geranylgeranyl diphosphate reductase, chloroplastic [Ipomoea batatas]
MFNCITICLRLLNVQNVHGKSLELRRDLVIGYHYKKSSPRFQIVNMEYRNRECRVMHVHLAPKVVGLSLSVQVLMLTPAGFSRTNSTAIKPIVVILVWFLMNHRKLCCGPGCLEMCEFVNMDLQIVNVEKKKIAVYSPARVRQPLARLLDRLELYVMVRCKYLEEKMRERVKSSSANGDNGQLFKMERPERNMVGPLTKVYIKYTAYNGGGGGERRTLEVDAVIGADGANSRVAKSINAGDYEYAIAFQERIRIPDDKMTYYEDLAEMYVGDDVSPDFYGWVFPKCDHVAVGTGTVTHKPDIKKFQLATRVRAAAKITGGKIIRVEAHPIPEHPRPLRVQDRVALVGDAAGYVTKCSGEGIYFAAKSGRMCAEAIVEGSENGKRMVDESDLRKYLEKWDKTYWPTYKVLDVLQKVFYRSNPAREAFVEMCADEYVQKMTFDSYLYKKVAPGNPIEDLKLAVNTIGSLVRANALRKEMNKLSV